MCISYVIQLLIIELRMVAFDYLSVFLIFYHMLIFHSAQAQNQSQDSCPRGFPCGILGNVSYPFSNSSQPDCGLYRIDCDATPSPRIHLGENVYTALNQRLNDSSFRVVDLRLEELLAKNSCQSFDRSVSFPSSPSVSFSTSERTVYLFRCTNRIDIDRSTNDNYFRDYLNYTECRGFSIYYKYPSLSWKGNWNPPEGVPDNCSLIQLPVQWSSLSNTQNSSLFGLLTANFRLLWSLSDDCSKCYYQGGRCLTDSNNEFRCSSNPQGKRKSKQILVVVLPAVIGLSLSICLFTVIWHFKKGKGGCSHTRNTYSDPSGQDLEGGSNYYGVPVFSYSILEQATNNFDSSKELGDGGFGTVYLGKLRDGREVAVKRLYEQSSKRMVQFKNEIEILTRLRHQNLVVLYGCTSRHSRELLLVYEYIPNGTVADHLHGEKAKNGTLIWPIRMSIAIETASALAYLHASDIVHRDVKTSNILLDNNFCVKVADFGLSRLFPTDVTHISTAPQGTPGYVDPEYNACYQLTSKSDVYSFGVVLIELVSSLPAVDIRRHRDEISLANFAMSKILKCAFEELIDPSLGYESDAEIRRMTTSVAELAFRCLQLENEMRPAMDEVLEILKAIQRGECENHMKEEIDFIDNELSNAEIPQAAESKNDVQLMKSKFHPSPNSVNDRWASSSTATSISG